MEIDGVTARWKRSGSAAVSMSRCRLRAARGQRSLPLCRVSPHRDNEGWSTGKDVQSSLTVCVPSELRPVSSVTIQLLWPPSAPPLSSWSLSQPVTHKTHSYHADSHTCTHRSTCMQLQTYMCIYVYMHKVSFDFYFFYPILLEIWEGFLKLQKYFSINKRSHSS